MKTLLEAYQSPVGEILIKWTVLVALGWCAHALLRSRDARWRLILWRGILCGGLLLLLTPLFSVPTYEILVDDQAVQRMTMNLSATAASKPKAMETKVEGEQHAKATTKPVLREEPVYFKIHSRMSRFRGENFCWQHGV